MDERPLAPSVEKARTLIGFEAQVTLDEMLDELILWIRDALDKTALATDNLAANFQDLRAYRPGIPGTGETPDAGVR